MSYEKLEDKYYSTSDLALAALLILYYPLNSINKENPKKVYFVFEKGKDFNTLIKKYWYFKIRIEPQAYFNSLKSIKTRIYGS